MKLDEKAKKLSEKAFLGFPPEDFERGGREQFIYMLRAGMNPDSKVVDVGCGVLRAGYWLIHFLSAGCYCGIEPHTGRLEMGINAFLDSETLAAKRPRFGTNPHFDTSVFGEKFDFFLAYSIWTHASKGQIQAMLDSFVRDSRDESVFLTSYLPANETNPDYQGNTWKGTSHESDVPGCIHHSLRWIEAECEHRGLMAVELGRDDTYGQDWLELKRRKRC